MIGSLRLVRNFKFVQIFLIGIVSGMPFSILYTAVIVWLKESNVALEVITTFALARMPYAFKAAWAPIIDNIKLPVLNQLLGRRKSWMVFVTLITSSLLFSLSSTDPVENFKLFRTLCFALGFSAATFDIVCDGWRIQVLDKEEQAVGIAAASLGFRIGALTTGAGALFVATRCGWSQTFFIIGIMFLIGILFILLAREPRARATESSITNGISIKDLYIKPFLDLIKREKALYILLAIMLYKMGDAMLSFTATPFYLEMGFTKDQIAWVVKVFAAIATVLGTFLGGFLMMKLGALRCLLICELLQSITNLTYIWIHHSGTDMRVFVICVIVENFTGGMGAASLGGFISMLCNFRYATTHFALLSSAATFVNNTSTAATGSLIKSVGWDNFFILTTVISIPEILLLLFLRKHISIK